MAQANVLASRVTGGQSDCPVHERVPRLTVGGVLAERHRELLTIDASCGALEALRLLADNNPVAVPVLDAGRLVGVFSLQGFALASVSAGVSAMALRVADLMAPCTCIVSPDELAQSCLQRMHENDLQFIPVQENGRLLALLSMDELLSGINANYEKVFRESALDQQILFLRGTYSC